ncbi:hypothetical protein GCM10025789_00980 [Tessaracoccus lubricantis]|uniref:Uncharacterized protein n=1 Tax=Tessaracoccus lubricantis TaxID=545543 RepID=A0ABP9EWG8_9ACTN
MLVHNFTLPNQGFDGGPGIVELCSDAGAQLHSARAGAMPHGRRLQRETPKRVHSAE